MNKLSLLDVRLQQASDNKQGVLDLKLGMSKRERERQREREGGGVGNTGGRRGDAPLRKKERR
ncbi:unnamed protein product [Prunus armeniaca]|uniref:Uncharacterized protein n=1 Tax=Prunus armeniaca TaxID=36596 RepID=A0A6J5VM43_PRUAR|nr:unnamed protein product [Prunus armeniaca]CAB4289112.1 unnamed protein product [Prunus armeniaca]